MKEKKISRKAEVERSLCEVGAVVVVVFLLLRLLKIQLYSELDMKEASDLLDKYAPENQDKKTNMLRFGGAPCLDSLTFVAKGASKCCLTS